MKMTTKYDGVFGAWVIVFEDGTTYNGPDGPWRFPTKAQAMLSAWKENMMTYLRSPPCPECGGVATFRVSREALAKYVGGAFAQDAFPELLAADRERLISGTCGPCWKKVMSGEEN